MEELLGIGVREAIEATNIPVISGKDSMKCSCKYDVDESFNLEDVPADLRHHITLIEEDGKRKIEIHDPDTYLASAAVKIEDYRKCVNSSLKQEGDLIYVVGTTKAQLGASQYNQAIGYKTQERPLEGGACPEADLEEFVTTADSIHSAIDQELVASCSYIHNGGLITALQKAAWAGDKGAQIKVDGKTTDEEYLYSETPGRFIVTIDPKDKDEFEATMGESNISLIGHVTNNSLNIAKQDGTKEQINSDKVKESYKQPLAL